MTIPSERSISPRISGRIIGKIGVAHFVMRHNHPHALRFQLESGFARTEIGINDVEIDDTDRLVL